MKNKVDHWQPSLPLNAIVFDCDGTLTQIEGIDHLAKNRGISQVISELTTKAMSQSGLNAALYEKRLALIAPTLKEVVQLSQDYFDARVEDSLEVIQLLNRLDKQIFILSAGVNPAVKTFGKLLEVPEKNIFAVDLDFSPQGQYLNFNTASPLIHNDGKKILLEKLKNHYTQVLFIGDGLNDVVASNIVNRFIGFGGVFYRENIKKQCDFYISQKSLATLLPFCLSKKELGLLTTKEKVLYQKGLTTDKI